MREKKNIGFQRYIKKNMYRMITKGEKYNMHKIGFQRYMVWVLLLLMLIGITACGKGRKQETGVLPSAPTEEQMEETDTEEDTDDGKNAETEEEISGEIETDETLTGEDQTGWTRKSSWPVLSHIWDIVKKMISPRFRIGYRTIILICLPSCPFWQKSRKIVFWEPVTAICFVLCRGMKKPHWR